MDATAKLPKSPDAKKNDIGISNRSPLAADQWDQKEGSPFWFREQAAKTENQYHLKKAERIREHFVK